MSQVALDSKDFLTSCLKLVLPEPGDAEDISEHACESGISAVSIGQGQVTVDELKEKLYITRDEAKHLLDICASTIAGNMTTSQEHQDHVSLKLCTTTSGRLALNLGSSVQKAAVTLAQVTDETPDTASVNAIPYQVIMDNAAVVVISRTSKNASEKKISAADEQANPLVYPAQPAVIPTNPVAAPVPTPTPPAPVAAPALAPSPAPVPELAPTSFISAIQPSPTPLPDPVGDSIPAEASPAPLSNPTPVKASPVPVNNPTPVKASPVPVNNPTPVKASPARIGSPAPVKASPARISSPAPVKASPARLNRPAPVKASSDELPPPELSASSPPLPSSPVSTPSYLRPTAVHNARASKDVTGAVTSSLAAVPEVGQGVHQRRHQVSRASTLLAPTQASAARAATRNEAANGKKDGPMTRASVQLDQRITKVQPFVLQSDFRPRSAALSTDDLRMAEAREKAFKPKPVPKHVLEHKPVAPVQRSAPKDPNAVFAPFQLASVERHMQKVEERRKKQEEEATREEEARRFKARAFDAAKLASSPAKLAAKKPAASPTTRAKAPVLASEARIAHYHAVVEPAKKARDEETNKEKLEAERKAKQMEEMSMDDYRKSLEFKARPMPDFSKPFQVDPSLARPVTVACEPELHTVQRLGAAPPPGAREDREGEGLGKGVYDGAGYVDPFFASLRKTGSGSSSRNGSLNAARASSTSLLRSALTHQPSGGVAASMSRAASGASNLSRSSATAEMQSAIRVAAARATEVQVKKQEVEKHAEVCNPGAQEQEAQ